MQSEDWEDFLMGTAGVQTQELHHIWRPQEIINGLSGVLVLRHLPETEVLDMRTVYHCIQMAIDRFVTFVDLY